MKANGPVRLYGGTSQRSFPLPANTVAIDLQNYSAAAIRFSFVTGKVDEAASTSVDKFPAYDILAPYAARRVYVSAASGTFYYAATFLEAEFSINPLTA